MEYVKLSKNSSLLEFNNEKKDDGVSELSAFIFFDEGALAPLPEFWVL